MRLFPLAFPPFAMTVALLSGCVLPEAGRETGAEPVFESEVVAEAEVAAPMTSEASRHRSAVYQRAARRGVVTAGDIDDGLNLTTFSRYLTRMARETGLPQLGLGPALSAQLLGPSGNPAPGARYTLRRPGAAEAFLSSYAGPDGRILIFPQVLGAGALGKVELRVFGEDGQELLRETLSTGTPQRVVLPQSAAWQPDFLDLVLVVDTTGSMGDEIAFLQKELIGATRAAASAAPGISLRFGLVAYRDDGDDYVVKTYGFTPDAAEMRSWLRGLSANGGGDYPEAAADALRAGVGLDWRRGKGERILIHLADAPPHDADAASYLRAATAAAGKGVQIFTIGASGVASESEYLMRQAALATGGRYVFLTDDSGVGLPHGEPTIPCYRVTKLSQLLTRILASELSGQRQEAAEGAVIREVGSYDAGICRD
jgi:hypothetical protein